MDTTGLVVIITAVHPNYWAGQDYKAEPTTGNLQEGRWFPLSANESLSDREDYFAQSTMHLHLV